MATITGQRSGSVLPWADTPGHAEGFSPRPAGYPDAQNISNIGVPGGVPVDVDEHPGQEFTVGTSGTLMGLEVLIFGPHVEKDGEMVSDFWPD